MDFSLSTEQELLLETARRYVGDNYSFEQRQKMLGGASPDARSIWNGMAELGLLALNVPEDYGGLAAGPLETMLVATALGEGLVVEPFISSAVLATRTIVALGSKQQCAEWLPRLASGELIAVLAHDTSGVEGRGEPAVRAEKVADGWRISGRQSVVYHAPLAELLLVTARTDEQRGSEIAVFAIPRSNVGVELDSYVTVDGQSAADIRFSAVEVNGSQRLGGDASMELGLVTAFGIAALCADTIGALDRTLAATVEYLRTRVQFGGPIGRFQALQHRVADMIGHIESARSMAHLATFRCTSPDLRERASALSAAKVVVGQAARFVGQQAVQLHGGMGVSDEVAISHYFRRLLANELRFGSTEAHLSRYAELMAEG